MAPNESPTDRIRLDTRVNLKDVGFTSDKLKQQNDEQKEQYEDPAPPRAQEKTSTTPKRIQRGSACWTALTSAGGSVTRPFIDICEPFLRPLSPRTVNRDEVQAIAHSATFSSPPSASSVNTNNTLSRTSRPALVLKLDKTLRRGTLVRNQPGRAPVSKAVKVLQVNRLGQYLVHDGAKMLFIPPAQVIKPGENGIRRLQTVKQAYNLFKTKDWRTLMQFCQKSLVEDFALF